MTDVAVLCSVMLVFLGFVEKYSLDVDWRRKCVSRGLPFAIFTRPERETGHRHNNSGVGTHGGGSARKASCLYGRVPGVVERSVVGREKYRRQVSKSVER